MRPGRIHRVLVGTVIAAAAIVTLAVRIPDDPAEAQGQAEKRSARIEGISRQPTQAAGEALLDANDAALLLDHQTGLFQTVKDVALRDLRANTLALAKIAEQAKMPIIYTASEPGGPNGPIM